MVFFFTVHVLERIHPTTKMKEETAYFNDHSNEINDINNVLSDNLSKVTFNNVIRYRTRGACFEKGVIQPAEKQYFDSEIIRLQNEIFVDCGAYNGDTIACLHNVMQTTKNTLKHIYAFEPSKQNATALKKYVENSELKNITIYEKAISDHTGSESFESGDSVNATAKIKKGGESMIFVDSLDNLLYGKKITFIKMDIEGAEISAINGAKAIIEECQPKLAICIYHSYQDLVELPLLIHKLLPNHQMFIRHYSKNWMETVCYAVPKIKFDK